MSNNISPKTPLLPPPKDTLADNPRLDSNRYVKLDKACDYIPGISTVSNITDVFKKCVLEVETAKTTQTAWTSNNYAYHLQNKSYTRCFILMIPVIGNLLVGVYDLTRSLMGKTKVLEQIKKDPTCFESLPEKYRNDIDIAIAALDRAAELDNAANEMHNSKKLEFENEALTNLGIDPKAREGKSIDKLSLTDGQKASVQEYTHTKLNEFKDARKSDLTKDRILALKHRPSTKEHNVIVEKVEHLMTLESQRCKFLVAMKILARGGERVRHNKQVIAKALENASLQGTKASLTFLDINMLTDPDIASLVHDAFAKVTVFQHDPVSDIVYLCRWPNKAYKNLSLGLKRAEELKNGPNVSS